jgi:hypothetical protein
MSSAVSPLHTPLRGVDGNGGGDGDGDGQKKKQQQQQRARIEQGEESTSVLNA